MADVGNSMMIDAGYKRLDNLSFLFDDSFRVVFDEEGNFLTISDGSFSINLTNEEVDYEGHKKRRTYRRIRRV